MADFGINATTLQAPQGAGSSPVAAVAPAKSMLDEIGSVVDIIAKGVVNSRKVEADAVNQSIVGRYAKELGALNDAMADGRMSPTEAGMRKRKISNTYLANNSHLVKDLTAVSSAFSGDTDIGQAEDMAKTQKARREQLITEAQKQGAVFGPNMTPEQEDVIINAAQSAVRVNADLEQMYKRNAEARAAGTFDEKKAEADSKRMAVKAINTLATDNLAAFQEWTFSLRGQATTPEARAEIEAKINSRHSNIELAILKAADNNPELAGAVQKLFASSKELAIKSLDPASELSDIKNQSELIKAKMELVALKDPSIAGIIVGSKLFGPVLPLHSVTKAIDFLSLMSTNPVSKDLPNTQIVGDPAIEKEAIEMLKDGLTRLQKANPKDAELGRAEASNSLNHILKQVGRVVEEGASASQLSALGKFFGSTEFGAFAAAGGLDKGAAEAAAKTYNKIYTPVVKDGVVARMNETLSRDPLKDVKSFSSKSTQPAPVTLKDVVEIKFTGAGVSFVPKEGAPSLDMFEKRSRDKMVKSMRESQEGLNQVIHIGAHLMHTQDYAKYWEENKHVLVPTVFPDPVKLKVGSVVKAKNGKSYKYLGGDFNDIENSYMEVSSGKSE